MVGFQLGAVAATAGSFVSRLCRLLVGFPPAATRSTDALGRPSGFALDDDYAVSYAYDMYGSFHSVASAASATSAVTFTYSFLPNSDLISARP